MRYEDLVTHLRKLPCFGSDDLVFLGDSPRRAANQLIRWTKEGKVWRLKRGLYTLPDSRRDVPLSLRWVANRLYSPSYVSLESALSFYDLIPEYVPTITSVSVAKTARFENPLGHFNYTNIKTERFFGFEEISDENGVLIRMATPEKAILDRIYFDKTWCDDYSYFEENLRLQNLSYLKPSRLKSFAQQFASKKMGRAVRTLIQLRRQS